MANQAIVSVEILLITNNDKHARKIRELRLPLYLPHEYIFTATRIDNLINACVLVHGEYYATYLTFVGCMQPARISGTELNYDY